MQERKIRLQQINNEQDIFIKFNKLVDEQYKKYELKYIEDVEFDEKHPLTFFSEIKDKKELLHSFDLNEFYDDLVFLNKDILHLVGTLYFLKPYINNPTEEDGTYFQNVFDKRYLGFASIVPQCIYNYWDRIGDILYAYFRTGLDERSVYFGRVIENFQIEYKGSTFYKRLKKMYDEKLRELIEDRKRIVHYSQVEARIYMGTFKYHGDENKLKEIQKEKENFPDYFREHLGLIIEGFELALKLINELPDKEKIKKE